MLLTTEVLSRDLKMTKVDAHGLACNKNKGHLSFAREMNNPDDVAYSLY